MAKPYGISKGVFIFPGENCELRLSNVHRDRFGHIFADVAIVTPNGEGFLAYDQGNLAQGKFRTAVASQAALRNSGNVIGMEDLLMDAFLALQLDPDVVPMASGPAFESIQAFIDRVQPEGPSLVEGLLEMGRSYSLASKPKVGKTILILNLAVATANGGTWLGQKVSQGPVCLFQLEDSETTLKKRLQAMTGGLWPANFSIQTESFHLTADNYDLTVQACQGASLVICDPIIQASKVRDWNSQQEVRDQYDLWRRLARDTNACVLLSTHHRKMTGDYGDQMAGSMQAQATVDGIIELYRDHNLDKTQRRVSFTGREWTDMEDSVITLNASTLIWEPSGTLNEARDQAREGRQQEKATDLDCVLPVDPPGFTYNELVELTGLKRGRVRDALKVLGEKVITGGRGTKPDPYRFHKTS